MRRVIAALIVAGLGAGVFLLWPRSPESSPSGDVSAPTTTTSITAPTTTTIVGSTTTLDVEGSHVVTTVEEAEEILRELWFGWFEGIYNQNEERIREVVVLEETVAEARKSFGVEFERAPAIEDISISDAEILQTDEDCLAVWRVLAVSGFRTGSTSGVEIVRWTGQRWQSLVTWRFKEDLWEADCDALLSS